MFFQICLLTAGLHLGRKLWKEWGEQRAESPPSTERRGAGGTGGESPEAEVPTGALVPQEHAERTPPTPSEGADTDAAAVQEQFETAIVATGLTAAGSLFFPQLRPLGGVSVMYGSIPIFAKAKHLVVDERRVGIEVLDSIGLIASIAARQYTISAVMFLFYAGAQKLRLKMERDARTSILDALRRQPDEVWILKDGVEASVPLTSLQSGDIVVVGAGSAVPVGGVVTEGTALVDQHVLTGESALAEKTVGHRVSAMTLVSAGKLHIQVETAGKQTAVAEISEVLQNTADLMSSIDLESKQIADASAVPILALSALAYPIAGARGTVAMLNVGIADNMQVVAPFSMLNYLRKAYEAGILFKDGRSLQLLPEVDTVVFDKTGTLTEGELRVRKIHAASGLGEEDVLSFAAAAEYRQTHPIARAITREAARHQCPVTPTGEIALEIGYGLTARVGDHTARVGSKRFMRACGLEVSEALLDAEQAACAQGSSLVYVAKDDVVLGLIELEPIMRPESLDVIRALKGRNLSLYLLSGDHEAPTRAMAERMGFDGYFSGVLPLDKGRIIDELQAQGKKVCFVGDGINDSIALKKATVSVSLSGASTVAMDSAQVTLLDQGLGKLPALFTVASDLQTNLRGILLSAIIPAAAAASGVLVAGFSTNAVAALCVASLASGMAIATWPHRDMLLHRARHLRDRDWDAASSGPPRLPEAEESGQAPASAGKVAAVAAFDSHVPPRIPK